VNYFRGSMDCQEERVEADEKRRGVCHKRGLRVYGATTNE